VQGSCSSSSELPFRFFLFFLALDRRISGISNDGSIWLPPSGPVRFVLIFVHGLGVFTAVNRPYYTHLQNVGFAILGTDHSGHGRSDGQRGDTSTGLLQDELELLVHRANVLFPEIPLFLYVHSLGGLVSLYFVMKDTFHGAPSAALILRARGCWPTGAAGSSRRRRSRRDRTVLRARDIRRNGLRDTKSRGSGM
jgi:alpha-beta hydrolase superfamily lysophospholipase